MAVVKAQQERSKAAEESGGVVIEGDAYVRVTFAEKPERPTLSALKAAGFRWSGGSWMGYRKNLPAELTEDHGPGCDGPLNCVCSAEPAGLVGCEVVGCSARFFLVPSRRFPGMCLEHSDEASRSVDGWTPENSWD